MCAFPARSAEQSLEDARHAGTRVILTNARDAALKDREENGRSSSQNKNHAFGHGC
jgi:hypothetical protein